jgi:hypothetical protein
MPRRAAGLDGGADLAVFVILSRLTAYARSGGISGLKGSAAGRTTDTSVLVLRDSMSGPKATVAGRTEPHAVSSWRGVLPGRRADLVEGAKRAQRGSQAPE